MKSICIDQVKFERRLGYGFLFLFNFLIISSSATMIFESNSMYVVTGINEYNGGSYSEYCYDSLWGTGQVCNCYGICAGMESERPKFHNELLFQFLFAILIGDGIIIYSKQNKFKFKWCEKASQKLREVVDN